MTRWLSLLLVCLLAVPAIADDPAGANRLLVEAVKMKKAAESKTETSEKLALLEGALANLNEIIERHPSSSLAVKLITDQPVGSLSMAALSDAIEKLGAEVSRPLQSREKTSAGPHLAAVSESTGFLLQIDVARLAATPFGERFWGLYRNNVDLHASEPDSQALEILARHLQGTDWVVLAADLTAADHEEELDKLAYGLVLQLTSNSGFDVAGLLRELTAPRPQISVSQVKHLVSGKEYSGYQVSVPDDNPLYILPAIDSKVFFAGLRPEPLTAAMQRYVSGDLADVGNLLPPVTPGAEVRLGAVPPASLRERMKNLGLMEQFTDTPELPLDEILGSVFEVGRVLIATRVDRHVTVDLDMDMDTTLSASVFYVLGNGLLLPALELLEENPFVTDPVLKLDGLNLKLRFELDGDKLLNRFEAALDESAARKSVAQTQEQKKQEAEKRAIRAYLEFVYQRLEEYKRSPTIAAERGLSGRVVLRFRVLRDGNVVDPETLVTADAEHDSFREAALQALARVGQLPPFPEEIQRRDLLVEAPLTYSIKPDQEQQ